MCFPLFICPPKKWVLGPGFEPSELVRAPELVTYTSTGRGSVQDKARREDLLLKGNEELPPLWRTACLKKEVSRHSKSVTYYSYLCIIQPWSRKNEHIANELFLFQPTFQISLHTEKEKPDSKNPLLMLSEGVGATEIAPQPRHEPAPLSPWLGSTCTVSTQAMRPATR